MDEFLVFTQVVELTNDFDAPDLFAGAARALPNLTAHDNDIPEVETIAKIGRRYAFGPTTNRQIHIGLANHKLEMAVEKPQEIRFSPTAFPSTNSLHSGTM